MYIRSSSDDQVAGTFTDTFMEPISESDKLHFLRSSLRGPMICHRCSKFPDRSFHSTQCVCLRLHNISQSLNCSHDVLIPGTSFVLTSISHHSLSLRNNAVPPLHHGLSFSHVIPVQSRFFRIRRPSSGTVHIAGCFSTTSSQLPMCCRLISFFIPGKSTNISPFFPSYP